MGLFLSKTLSEILLSVGPFSAVSAITSLPQVCFGLVNYQTEGLHVLLQMTVKRSINFRWSSVMALVKLQSNFFKPGQTWSNIVKLVKALLSLKRGLGLTYFNTFGYFQPVLALIGLSRFTCMVPGKYLGLKWGFDT